MPSYIDTVEMPKFDVWNKIKTERRLSSLSLELTARCNLNCHHCYINIPANPRNLPQAELTVEEIDRIFDEAVELGAFWVLITGGEPLLRQDFFDIYHTIRHKGILVSLFTNATMITPEIADLLVQYPPRELEITAYGASPKIYDRVTRIPGSFKKFVRGLTLLKERNVRFMLKAMAIQSNYEELDEIERFCSEWTNEPFRCDPTLHMRYDGDPKRNQDIISERLTAEQIMEMDRKNPDKINAIEKLCLPNAEAAVDVNRQSKIFKCGAGANSVDIGWRGDVRLCTTIVNPKYTYSLHTGTLRDAWENFIPKLMGLHSDNPDFIHNCGSCGIQNLCGWCPAHSMLENGRLDQPIDYFCNIAHKRAKVFTKLQLQEHPS